MCLGSSRLAGTGLGNLKALCLVKGGRKDSARVPIPMSQTREGARTFLPKRGGTSLTDGAGEVGPRTAPSSGLSGFEEGRMLLGARGGGMSGIPTYHL